MLGDDVHVQLIHEVFVRAYLALIANRGTEVSLQIAARCTAIMKRTLGLRKKSVNMGIVVSSPFSLSKWPAVDA